MAAAVRFVAIEAGLESFWATDSRPWPNRRFAVRRLSGLYDRGMSPKAKHVLAREHLNRGLQGVTVDDYTEAVTWLFLALEAAIVAVADRHGIDTKKQHAAKADAAAELHRRGVLPDDFSSTLRVLNAARKVATYEGEEPDLEGESLEDIAADVEAAVDLAEQETSA